jgi:hypothetical protein
MLKYFSIEVKGSQTINLEQLGTYCLKSPKEAVIGSCIVDLEDIGVIGNLNGTSR